MYLFSKHAKKQQKDVKRMLSDFEVETENKLNPQYLADIKSVLDILEDDLKKYETKKASAKIEGHAYHFYHGKCRSLEKAIRHIKYLV